MEDTLGAPAAPTRPADASGHLLASAVRYAQERHWDVLPGTWLEDHGNAAGPRCSCGAARCPAPGAHPARPDWSGVATGGTATLRRLWDAEPLASVLLPTGRGFDAVDVSEMAGCLALARMERLEVTPGPVLCTPARRLVFLVLPGAAVKLPALLRRTGLAPASLDLVARGAGDWVAAPPTRTAGGPVRWAREPNALNRWLPDVEDLLSPLAYACGREAADRRSAAEGRDGADRRGESDRRSAADRREGSAAYR